MLYFHKRRINYLHAYSKEVICNRCIYLSNGNILRRNCTEGRLEVFILKCTNMCQSQCTLASFQLLIYLKHLLSNFVYCLVESRHNPIEEKIRVMCDVVLQMHLFEELSFSTQDRLKERREEMIEENMGGADTKRCIYQRFKRVLKTFCSIGMSVRCDSL